MASGTALGGPDAHTIRLAVLSPRGTTWTRALKRLNHALRNKSEGRLKLKVIAGGRAGDERRVTQQLRDGELDGAALTYLGLGDLVPAVMVLQLPGLFRAHGEVAEVRTMLYFDFADEFEQRGFTFLGWGDVGDRRLFSKKPLIGPKDVATSKPWMWRGDPLQTRLLSLIGARGVPLNVLEVRPALKDGRINAFLATAMSAVALQWYEHASWMSASTQEPVIGATVVRKEAFARLPPDLQEMLAQMSVEEHRRLLGRVADEDRRAADALRRHGLKEFDMLRQEAQWESVLLKLADDLADVVYSRELLKKVWRIARKAEWPNMGAPRTAEARGWR